RLHAPCPAERAARLGRERCPRAFRRTKDQRPRIPRSPKGFPSFFVLGLWSLVASLLLGPAALLAAAAARADSENGAGEYAHREYAEIDQRRVRVNRLVRRRAGDREVEVDRVGVVH